MPIRKYNPTSPGVRGKTSLTFDEITTNEPYAPLTENLHRSGGRNNQGHLTSWWRGGGHRRLYRVIDFKRDKKDIPGKVSTVEYDPNRSARIALISYADGEKRYILQPAGMKVGDTVVAGDSVDILPGNCLPLKNIPLGTQIHNVELRPGKGPHVRGVAMNPVDHPLGGGEGKTSGGRHPVTPWGQPTKGYKTRRRKDTDRFIVQRRTK